MAENLIGSEIIRLGNEISRRIREGEHIYNLTIGDFDPALFPIPDELRELIIHAYNEGQTNYPPADGIVELRTAVCHYLNSALGLSLKPGQIQIAGGARPLIYTIYRTLVDPGDKVIFPVPSWNNNHYCHLTGARPCMLHTRPESNFMPLAEDLAPHLTDAVLLALCSPLNPTGTCFSEQQLRKICELVLAENRRRGSDQKPLYVLYDQIYWPLMPEDLKHVHPLAFEPELEPYTVYVDGISKCLAATGVRVGWASGPEHIISRMRAVLGHIGAWAPKAEQWAVAQYLSLEKKRQSFIHRMIHAVSSRQKAFYDGLKQLQHKGLPVEVIQPTGAIYLSVRFNVHGLKTPQGELLSTASAIAEYLLASASVAVVPFTAFGLPPHTDWFRISVGTCRLEEIPDILLRIENSLKNLQKP
jgi:aspartate aminotransferase